MGIAEDDVERVRSAQPISAVIANYVALRRTGRNHVGLCPFHGEKTGSFNVRDETGRYKCFGCGASGDVFTFIQEVERLDFVGAIEHLAAKAGITLNYTTGGQPRDRQRGKQLVEVMAQAVEWYHQRLLTSPDAKAARDYLRSRNLSGDVARQFKLGWAPDAWDALSVELGAPAEMLRDCGLAFTNSRGRAQDSFRARVMFPIFKENDDPVAFGGRVLPGSTDPAKYKNSAESKIYAKSKTLYGLNWAKSDVVKADEIVVCEGYTDVIGFHRAGLTRAVATCGTALTEDHVRLMKRFAKKVVLAFDADAAGQGAAARFYEWEQKIGVDVSVAKMHGGKDPGDMADSDPQGLIDAVTTAEPFMKFRIERAVAAGDVNTNEGKAALGNAVVAVINEHPNTDVRRLYAGELEQRLGLQRGSLASRVERRGGSRPLVNLSDVVTNVAQRAPDSAEIVMLALMCNKLDEVLGIVSEEVFSDEAQRAAFRALKASGGNLNTAIREADPDARAVLEIVGVADATGDVMKEGINLLRAAVRRELTRRVTDTSPEVIQRDRRIKQLSDQLTDRNVADSVASELLAWLYEVSILSEA